MTTTLCAIMKNEERYLLEWIAYHRLLGFDRIVIYENDSWDGTPALLEQLYKKGFIDCHKPWSDIQGSPQILAYEDAICNCSTDWIMFLDADEFLNIKSRAGITHFLSQFPSNVIGIAINWRLFGSAGHIDYSEDLILERFTRAATQTEPINRHVKSIIKPECVDHIHVHAPALKQGTYISPSGQPVPMVTRGLSETVDWSIAQINHYFTKSKEEYNMKKLRGDGSVAADDSRKFTKYSDWFFERHDLNDESDTSIGWAIPLVVEHVNAMKNAIEWASNSRS